jgi:hypothetical protein
VCGSTLDGLPIISNQNFQSGGNKGFTIDSWPASTGACGLSFTIGNGSTRAQSSPKEIAVPQNVWMYVALNIDFTAHNLNWYIFTPSSSNPGTYTETNGTTSMSTAIVPADGTGYGVYGIGEDGTGTYYYTSCKPNHTCSNNIPTIVPANIADLAFWNRDLTAAELQSIVNSQQPLSTLNP